MFVNIEAERVRKGYSKGFLAKMLGVETDELCDWITRRRAIPACKLRALSQSLGCSVDYLLREEVKIGNRI